MPGMHDHQPLPLHRLLDFPFADWVQGEIGVLRHIMVGHIPPWVTVTFWGIVGVVVAILVTWLSQHITVKFAFGFQ